MSCEMFHSFGIMKHTVFVLDSYEKKQLTLKTAREI